MFHIDAAKPKCRSSGIWGTLIRVACTRCRKPLGKRGKHYCYPGCYKSLYEVSVEENAGDDDQEAVEKLEIIICESII